MAFGSSGQDKIEIVVEVDSKGAARILGQTQKAVEDVGKATTSATAKVDSFVGEFTKGAAVILASVVSIEKAFQGLERGAAFDDLSQGFSNLATQAGASADVLLNDLHNATSGTISDFALMQRANESLLAGLDPTKFADVATQVRKLADNLNVDLREALDITNDALVRGNDMGLKKRLGLNVDLEASERMLKEAYGNTNEELTESAKVAAHQLAIYATLEEKTSSMASITDDAADKIGQIKTAFINGADKALAQAASLEIVNTSLDSLAETIRSFPLKEIVTIPAAIGSMAYKAVEFLGEGIANQSSLIADRLTGAAGGFTDKQRAVLEQHIEEINKLIAEKTPEAVAKAKEAYNGLVESQDKLILSGRVYLRSVLPELYGEIERAAAATGEHTKENKKQTDVSEMLKKKLEELRSVLGEGGLIKDQKGAAEASKKAAEELAKLAEKAKELNSIKGIKSTADEIESIYKNAKELKVPFMEASKEVFALEAALNKAGQSADSFGIAAAGAADAATKSAQEAAKKLQSELANGIAQGFGEAIAAALAGEDVGGAVGTALQGIGSIIGKQMGTAAGTELSTAFSDILSPELGAEIGGTFGSIIGAAVVSRVQDDITKISQGDYKQAAFDLDVIFPGIGTAGKMLADHLFGDSAATAARKQADKFFADVFKDLQFSGNQDPTQGIFAGLSAQAQAQYQATGDVLTQALGLATDQGLNLGVVLANNNLTLSDLPAIIEASGQSFESLSATMYEAFYNGELSALALQNRLEEIYGIINGSTAFANLGEAVKAALSADGRTLLNAIKGIGIQAQATGVTLGSMPDILVSKFGIAANQVQQIMAAMAAAGIKSLADLANASQSTLTAVAANIEQAKQGITPDNVAVVKTAVATTGGGGGGSKASSAPRAATSRAKPVDPNIAKRQAILSAYNKVSGSGAVKDLDALVQAKQISDDEYVKRYQAIVEKDRELEAKIQDSQKAYAEDVIKGSKKKFEDLKKLNKLKDDLEAALKASEKSVTKDQTDLQRLDLFAQKFSGNIDLIRKAAAGLKIDISSLAEDTMRSFLAGTDSFIEAKNKLDAANGGDTKTLLDKLKKLGTHGGQYSVDTLKQIGAAAKSSGVTDFGGLAEQLIGKGAAGDDVEKLMLSLRATGVETLDSLAGVSNETAVKIGAQMQGVGFSFEETTSTVRDELKALDALLNQPRKVTVEMDAIVSPLLRQLLDLAQIPIPASGSGYGNNTPGVSTVSSHANQLAKKHDKNYSGPRKYWDAHAGKYTNQSKSNW